MKYFIFLVSFILLSSRSFGQPIQVLSKASGEEVAYAHILYLKNDSIVGGTYANSTGLAFLKISDKADKIEILHIGYKKLNTSPDKLGKVVYLEENTRQLEEVVLPYPQNPETVVLGRQPKWPIHTLSATRGFEIVTFISNPFESTKYIKSFVFRTKQWGRKRAGEMKVVFYRNAKGRPGEKLPVEAIVKLDKHSKKKITVNLEDAHILLPAEGIFTGIEWMGCLEERPEEPDLKQLCNHSIAYIPSKKEEAAPTFSRHRFINADWFLLNTAESDYPTIPVPAFRLEIYK